MNCVGTKKQTETISNPRENKTKKQILNRGESGDEM